MCIRDRVCIIANAGEWGQNDFVSDTCVYQLCAKLLYTHFELNFTSLKEIKYITLFDNVPRRL